MKIIIIDDDPFVCASLKTILQAEPDIEVTATGASGEDAIALCSQQLPDILLMDIQMGAFSGLDAGEQLLAQYPALRILYLTTFSDDAYIKRALQIGAKGYLIKQEVETVAPALRAVLSGQSVFGGEVVVKLPSLLSVRSKLEPGTFDLNEREMEVVELVAKGLSNREIAETLFLSEGTVRNYLSVILDKLSLRDRTQLAVFYYQHQGL